MSYDEEDIIGGVDPIEDEDLLDAPIDDEEFDLNDFDEEDPDKDH